MNRQVIVSCVGGEAPTRMTDQEILGYWRRKLQEVLPDRPDLIVLPEYCLPAREGIGPGTRLDGAMEAMLCEIAATHRCYLVYPVIRAGQLNGGSTNLAVLIDRAGRPCAFYHKQYPSLQEQQAGIVPGKGPAVWECDFGSVGVAICFDLNFDEAFEHYRTVQPDLIVFPSLYHGGLMQAFRAYQCRSHLVAAMGKYNLPSEIRRPTGELIAATTNYRSTVSAELFLDSQLVHLDFNYQKLRQLKEKHGRSVEISDPGRLGAVLVTRKGGSEDLRTLLERFAIEPLDDYLERSRRSVLPYREDTVIATRL